MKKLSKLIVIALGLLLMLASCRDDVDKTLIQETNQDESVVTYEIDLIRTADKQEFALTKTFLVSNHHYGKTHFCFDDDYDSMDVVEYTNLKGKGIILTYDDENKNCDELSLILVANEDNKLITYYEHDKKDHGDTFEVTVYHEGNAWFYAEVQKNTEKILNYTIFGAKSGGGDDDGGGISFSECMGAAIGACLDDPECAFMCGILWKWCLSSIALACALVAL